MDKKEKSNVFLTWINGYIYEKCALGFITGIYIHRY